MVARSKYADLFADAAATEAIGGHGTVCACGCFQSQSAQADANPSAAPVIVNDYTALLSHSWQLTDAVLGQPMIVTYSITTALAAHHNAFYAGAPDVLASFRQLTADETALARQAFQNWGAISGITFIEVPSGLGDIQITRLPAAAAGVLAFAFLPEREDSTFDIAEKYDGFAGDIIIGGGSPNVYTFMHEIGHALGLKHPFTEYPWNSRILDPSLDNTSNTVMSYTFVAPVITALGPLDIQAGQYLYGTNANDGGHLSGWSWDAATNTLTQTGKAGADTIRGVFGADVINAGGGDDTVFSTYGDDQLNGEGGNDRLFGGEGDDTIRGGEGGDFIQGSKGRDQVFGDAGDDVIVWDAGDAQIDGGDGVDLLAFTTGSGPLAFDLLANGFEAAEARLSDEDLGTVWATQTLRYTSAWRLDYVLVTYDDGTSTALDYDQDSALIWTTNYHRYDALGGLDINVTEYDNGRIAAYDYDQAGEFAWSSNWVLYTRFDGTYANVTTFDNGAVTSNEFDPEDIFDWHSNWISRDALGRLDLNNTVFDNGVQSAYDFDQADEYAWSSNWNQYAADGALDINVTVFDDGASNSNDFDQANSFDWASSFNSRTSAGELDYNVVVFDNGDTAVMDYDQDDAFAWATIWRLYNSGGALIGEVITPDGG